ncbi:hypothetical protein O7627_06700 [Solwaraspora sp. WMMD1047]|uniref:hypothetical protein n=1 Tax=Solwaraspora sp. WMMD1047 TaxID=3016102 RepID=UPI002417AD95|nr:hypothetical protein [Solwaraspora sp. WMMD1047]MDG4828996.1 hypothetical protein [Solwaraspora sp. WMMD1047]
MEYDQMSMTSMGGGSGRGTPGLTVVLVLLGTESLLIAFSVGSAMMGQSALAVMAGTAAITLAGEIVRRFLTTASVDGTHRGGRRSVGRGHSGAPGDAP